MALPGLSFEIVRSTGPVLGIRADRTAILALTERGPEEVPTLVHSAEDFIAHFGSPVDGMLGPLAAEAYFKNGGTELVVVRFLPRSRNATDAAVGVASRATGTIGVVGATDGSLVLDIRAKDSGAYANRITVEAIPTLRKRVRGTVVPGSTPADDAFVLRNLSSPFCDSVTDLDLPVRLLAHGSTPPQSRVERWGRLATITNSFVGPVGTQSIALTGNVLDDTDGLAILEIYDPSFTLRIREPTRADILVAGIDLRFIEQANQKLESTRIGLELSAAVDHPELPQPDLAVHLAGGTDGLTGVATVSTGTVGVVGATDGSLALTVRAKDSGPQANRITVEAMPNIRKRIQGNVVPGLIPADDAFVLSNLSSPVFDTATDLDLPVRLLAHESAPPQSSVERWGRIDAITSNFPGPLGTQSIALTGNILDATDGIATLEVYEPSFTLRIREPGRSDILVSGIDLRFIDHANLKLGSACVELELSAVVDHPELPQPDLVVHLAGGSDGLSDASNPALLELLDCMRASFLRALEALQSADLADVVIAPDLWSRVFRTKGVLRLAFDATTAIELSDQLVLAAERSRDRVVVIDPPLGGEQDLRPLGVEELERWRAMRGDRLVAARDFAAAYTPWVRVTAGPRFKGDDTLIMPPSPFVTGRMALTARQRGPWVATGNISLEGVVGLEQSLSLADEERLQDCGLNPLRMMLPRGATIQGVRSLSWPDRKAWRFLSTRRLFNFLRRALRPIGLSYAFEPNAPATWIKLRRDIERLLRDMYAQNAFAGAQPESAFFVKIDDQINPEDSRGNGVLTALIGVAPALPLEFLVIRLIVGRGLVDVTEEPILR